MANGITPKTEMVTIPKTRIREAKNASKDRRRTFTTVDGKF